MFDLLHVGHIRALKAAKRFGVLIVHVASDKESKCVKGTLRPIIPGVERAEMMKALKFVDEVFLSIDKDKSVCKSLDFIRPDIFANGGDRIVDNIPEKEICEKLGIKIIDGLGKKIRYSSKLIAKSQSLNT